MGNNDIDNLKTVVEDDGANPNYDKIKCKAINFELLKSTRDYLVHTITNTEADLLPKDGSEAMTGDLNMTNHGIINLKDPKPSDNSHAASVNFVNTTINNSNTILNGIIDKKIKESETSSIDLVDQENVFKIVMDDDLFKEDDDDIHKIGVKNKDFHLVNKKTYEFKIDYDSSIGYYSTRLSIDLIYLDAGNYTMVFEMYVEDGITIDQIEGSSGTLSGMTTKSNIDGTKTRSIIHFSYNGLASGFNDLDIDIKLKSKTDPQTTIYVVVYGVKGNVNNVSVGLWDRLYYYDNDSIEYEVPIDMKNRQIKNVGDGNENADAVNFKQLNEVEKQFIIVNNTVARNNANITTINVNNGYYYFTNQLNHNNLNTVSFPNITNSYPYSNGKNTVTGNKTYLVLRILLSGNYQIIYTDSYKNGGSFVIHDNTNGIDLFVVGLNNKLGWTPITINAVIPINVDNGFNHADIQLMIRTTNNAILDGSGKSTFHIKYLGA